MLGLVAPIAASTRGARSPQSHPPPQPRAAQRATLARSAGSAAQRPPDRLGALLSQAVLQRKLAGALREGDANLRLQHLLQQVTRKGSVDIADNSRYEQIVASSKMYDWPKIQQEFGPFSINLSGYVRNDTPRRVLCYRADGRSPEILKGSKPAGFGVRSTTPFTLLKADLLKDVAGFAEDHVRQNRQDLKSYATETTAGGYASADRHLYEIDFGTLYEFSPPSQGKLLSPLVLADTPDLADATKIAIDTRKATKEVFVLFEVGLGDIKRVRRPGRPAFEDIDWSAVQVATPNKKHEWAPEEAASSSPSGKPPPGRLTKDLSFLQTPTPTPQTVATPPRRPVVVKAQTPPPSQPHPQPLPEPAVRAPGRLKLGGLPWQ